MSEPSTRRVLTVGFLVGFLLNLTGWIGNNFLLGSLWQGVRLDLSEVAWRESIWRDVFSFFPDYLYGFAIAWLCVKLRPLYPTAVAASWRAGLFVSLVGGVTAYFGIANSGFIPWPLAFASFALVLATKMPLAILAGRWLEPRE